MSVPVCLYLCVRACPTGEVLLSGMPKRRLETAQSLVQKEIDVHSRTMHPCAMHAKKHLCVAQFDRTLPRKENITTGGITNPQSTKKQRGGGHPERRFRVR